MFSLELTIGTFFKKIHTCAAVQSCSPRTPDKSHIEDSLCPVIPGYSLCPVTPGYNLCPVTPEYSLWTFTPSTTCALSPLRTASVCPVIHGYLMCPVIPRYSLCPITPGALWPTHSWAPELSVLKGPREQGTNASGWLQYRRLVFTLHFICLIH